jgi:hypothetical protein
MTTDKRPPKLPAWGSARLIPHASVELDAECGAAAARRLLEAIDRQRQQFDELRALLAAADRDDQALVDELQRWVGVPPS